MNIQELNDTSRINRAVVKAYKDKVPLTFDKLLPLVVEEYKTGEPHRNLSYIKHGLKKVLQWLGK